LSTFDFLVFFFRRLLGLDKAAFSGGLFGILLIAVTNNYKMQ
jgi:hypothetical protein